MDLSTWIALARQNGASDLHLEPTLPPAIRVRGALRLLGEPLSAGILEAAALEVIGPDEWPAFQERRSADFSRTFAGVRCRFNVFHSSRGIGFAIRLLSSFQATLEKLNLHPDLRRFASASNGLLLVSGPTGSGKSSTMAALIQEINLTASRHIVTVENPIEYTFQPQKSFIRQREVGRDTPSFEQALLDALREDPDVLMVGEMRDPETMRLTLNASETGHLVLATVHSSNCAEALQRVVSAFPAEIQNSVAAQLADCLVGVVAQRLSFRADLDIRIPECEILVPTYPIKNFIRNRDFFKIPSSMETGADQGMWTFARYKSWLDRKTSWHIPGAASESQETSEAPPAHRPVSPALSSATISKNPPQSGEKSAPAGSGRLEIEPVDGGLASLLRRLQ